MRVKRIVLGTGNPGKFSEWSKILSEEGFRGDVVGISDIAKVKDPKENGDTFEVNAKQKAVHYAKLIRDYVLSEDGGYEVDALNGAPGVKSRRILPGDKEGTDEELIDYILKRLNGVPVKERGVKLTVAAAFSDPKGNIIFEDRNSLEGIVANKPCPVRIPGYPFRSIHYLPKLRKTYAELTVKEHEKYNHKRPIAKRLASFLSES